MDYKFGYTKYNYGFFLAIYIVLMVLGALRGVFSVVAILIFTAFFAAVILLVLGSGMLFGQGYKERALAHFREIFADCTENSDEVKP